MGENCSSAESQFCAIKKHQQLPWAEFLIHQSFRRKTVDVKFGENEK